MFLQLRTISRIATIVLVVLFIVFYLLDTLLGLGIKNFVLGKVYHDPDFQEMTPSTVIKLLATPSNPRYEPPVATLHLSQHITGKTYPQECHGYSFQTPWPDDPQSQSARNITKFNHSSKTSCMFVFKTGKKFMVSVHDEMDVLWHDTLNGPFFFIRGFFFPWDLDEAFYLRRLTVLNRFYDFNLLHWPGEGLRQAIYHSFGSVSVSANFPPGTQIYSIETPAISGFQYGEPRQLSKTFEPPFSKEPRKISGLWFELFDKANKRDIMLSLTDDSSSRQKLTQSEINTILASFKPVLAASKHGG